MNGGIRVPNCAISNIVQCFYLRCERIEHEIDRLDKSVYSFLSGLHPYSPMVKMMEAYTSTRTIRALPLNQVSNIDLILDLGQWAKSILDLPNA